MAQRRNSSERSANLASYALLVFASAFVLVPILWAISTSFKEAQVVTGWPPEWIPSRPTLQNYVTVLSNPKFLRYMANTFLVIAVVMALGIGMASHAAWVAVRKPFAGKKVMMFLMWTTIMIPGVSIIVPLYLLAVDLGLYDSFWVLMIVYGAMVLPTLVWLLRGFVEAIPPQLEEAALIDGASQAGVFYRIVVPLMRPGFGAAAILVFVSIWNEFLIAYALVLGDEHRLIQAGIYFFVTDAGIEWGPLMAGMVVSALPIVLLFALLQRFFLQGLTGGAVKG